VTDTKTNNVPTFEYGDTIHIELRVSDSSGISRIEIRFRNEGEGSVKSIHRSVVLEGETDATALIELPVGEDVPPGDYVCEYVALTDRKGNTSLVAAPDMGFRIEGTTEDQQGPALLDWSIA
jgi:hypothetical protein